MLKVSISRASKNAGGFADVSAGHRRRSYAESEHKLPVTYSPSARDCKPTARVGRAAFPRRMARERRAVSGHRLAKTKAVFVTDFSYISVIWKKNSATAGGAQWKYPFHATSRRTVISVQGYKSLKFAMMFSGYPNRLSPKIDFLTWLIFLVLIKVITLHICKHVTLLRRYFFVSFQRRNVR